MAKESLRKIEGKRRRERKKERERWQMEFELKWQKSRQAGKESSPPSVYLTTTLTRAAPDFAYEIRSTLIKDQQIMDRRNR